MNNIQWASNEPPKLVQDEVDLVKSKGFTDLTAASGQAIKESITAHNKLTSQIVKNIETGKSQKDEQIKFWTELAPKATGEIYDTIQGIKEIRGELNLLYDQTEKLEKEDETAVELNNILSKASGSISGILASTNDFEGANAALEGRNKHQVKKGLLNKYWKDIRKDVYEAAGELEFEIDGKIYSYNGTRDPWIRYEIRKKIDIAIAAQAYSTGAFSKKEILSGILLKSNKENESQLQIEIVENQKEEIKNYILKKDKLFIEDVKSGNPQALAIDINNIYETTEAKIAVFLQENPGAKREDYPGQSTTQQVFARVTKLLELARIGEDDGGLTPDMVEQLLTNSGTFQWAGETKEYPSILAAYNEKHNGKGNGWLDELNNIRIANWDKKKTDIKGGIESTINEMNKALDKAETLEDYTAIITKFENVLHEEYGQSTVNQYLDQSTKDRFTYKNIDLNKAQQEYNLIAQRYENRLPVSPAEVAKLPQFMQRELLKDYGGLVWSIGDTKIVEEAFLKYNTPLNDKVMKAAGIIEGSEDYRYAYFHIKQDLHIELIQMYDAAKADGKDHKTALKDALKQFEEKYRWMDDIFDSKSSNQASALEKATKLVKNLADPGFGLDIETDSQFNLRMRSQKFFVNNVIGSPNATRESNTILFYSEEILPGETSDTLRDLEAWLRSDGYTPLPQIYKKFSEVSGIPVERIALYRGASLAHTFTGDDVEAQRIVINHIKTLKEKIQNRSPLSQQLISATSISQANLIEFSKGIEENDAFISDQFFPGAVIFAENNEDLTAYDYIQRTDQADYKHDVAISSMELGAISKWDANLEQDSNTLFGRGQYFNIGAFGIANETEFNIIYDQLLKKGVIKPTDKFDQETQLKFRTQALLNRNAKLQEITGIVQFPTTLTKQELDTCGLGDQQYPLNEDLCKIIHSENK